MKAMRWMGWCVVVLVSLGMVSGSAKASVWYLSDPEVTISGNMVTDPWNSGDNRMGLLSADAWVWDGSRPEEPVATQTLLQWAGEVVPANDVTISVPLANGSYDIGILWFNHGGGDFSLQATVEGQNANMWGTGGNGHFYWAPLGQFGVTDGNLTLQLGDANGPGWFSVGAISAVPEPCTLGLAMVGSLFFLRRKK